MSYGAAVEGLDTSHDAVAHLGGMWASKNISWTGETLAIWAMLVVATAMRARGLVLLALFGVATQQVGDTVAARVTNVDVFITNIGLALSALSLALIFLQWRLARKVA